MKFISLTLTGSMSRRAATCSMTCSMINGDWNLPGARTAEWGGRLVLYSLMSNWKEGMAYACSQGPAAFNHMAHFPHSMTMEPANAQAGAHLPPLYKLNKLWRLHYRMYNLLYSTNCTSVYCNTCSSKRGTHKQVHICHLCSDPLNVILCTMLHVVVKQSSCGLACNVVSEDLQCI